jgi:predicted transcriptional regulator
MTRTTSTSPKKTTIHPSKILINKMIAQKQLSSSSISNQEQQELKNMSRRLRQLKRQMFLRQAQQEVSPVNSFRSLIIDLAVEQEAREAYRSRSDSMSSTRTSSFDGTLARGDSLRSIQE